jgi:hypothetical protein
MVFLKWCIFVPLLLAAPIPSASAAQDLRGVRTELSNPPPAASRRGSVVDGSSPFSHLNVQRAAARIHPERRSTAIVQTGTNPSRHAIGWAIASGIGAGAGVAAVAASRYGENETGTFCTRCFAEWSAISIPIGAGVGAAIGYVVDRVRR